MSILKRIFGGGKDAAAEPTVPPSSSPVPAKASPPVQGSQATSPEKGAMPLQTAMKTYAVWFRFTDPAVAAQSLQTLREAKSPFPFQLPHEISHLGGKIVGDYVAVVLQTETAIDERDRVKEGVASWVTSCGVKSFTKTECQSWTFPMTTEMLATAIVGSGNIRDRFGNIAQRPRVDERDELTEKRWKL